MRYAALCFVLALAGCGITANAPGPSACPAPVEYTAVDQAQAAKELGPLRGTIIHRMIDDYGVERAKLRACASN